MFPAFGNPRLNMYQVPVGLVAGVFERFCSQGLPVADNNCALIDWAPMPGSYLFKRIPSLLI